MNRSNRLPSLKLLVAGAALAAGAFLTGCIADAGSASAREEGTVETASTGENTLAVAAAQPPRCPQWQIDYYQGHQRYWAGRYRDLQMAMNRAPWGSQVRRNYEDQMRSAHYSLTWWTTEMFRAGHRNNCSMPRHN